MRVTLTAPDSRGPRVIQEIPDIELCRLEGRNGIGKTLAVRLLELCSGGQPYAAHEHSWSTLRDQLGRVQIRIEGLPVGAIDVELTPSEWPERPTAQIDTKLGTVKIDGRTSTWSELRTHVQVTRVAGDEGLTQTFAIELQERANHVGAVLEEADPVFVAWDEYFDGLSSAAGSVSRADLEALMASATEGHQALKTAEATHEENRAQLEMAERRYATLASFAERQAELPSRLQELSAALGQVAEADQAIGEVSEALQVLAARAAIEERQRPELVRLEHLRPRRRRDLQELVVAERGILAALGLGVESSDRDLRAAREEALRDVRDAQKQLRELDLVGGLKRTIGDLQGQLRVAPKSLDREIIAAVPEPITTASLRDGLATRMHEVERLPRDGEVAQLARRAETADRRRLLAQEALECRRKAVRKRELVEEAETAFVALLGLEAKDRGEYEALESRLRGAQEARLSAAVRLNVAKRALAQLLGVVLPEPASGPESEIDDELEMDIDAGGDGELEVDEYNSPDAWQRRANELEAEALRELRVLAAASGTDPATVDALLRLVPEELDTALTEARETLDRLGAEATHSRVTLADAEQRSKASAGAIEEAHRAVRSAYVGLTDPSGVWAALNSGLRDVLGVSGESEAVTADLELASALGRVSMVAEWFASAANKVREILSAAELVLNSLARELDPRVASSSLKAGGRSPASSDFLYEASIRRWSESELGKLVSGEVLRHELFDDSRHVSVDLRRAIIAWQASEGVPRQRPLEAFSSGEQVFLYTRAKLERLRDSRRPSAYSLVVLDEFGAFVARDRLGQLLSYVRESALGTIADQVVIILPLAQDFANDKEAPFLRQLAEGFEGVPAGLLNRIRQLESRNYFATSADGL